MNVEQKLETAMTVSQLREELETFDDDAVVVFSCLYGDRSRTMQALPVTMIDELEPSETIVESAYSESGLAIADKENPDDLMLSVVVLQ